MSKEINITAYHRWLFAVTDGDRKRLVQQIYDDVLEQNQQAFALLESTGDKNYTADTFYKAADNLLSNIYHSPEIKEL